MKEQFITEDRHIPFSVYKKLPGGSTIRALVYIEDMDGHTREAMLVSFRYNTELREAYFSLSTGGYLGDRFPEQM